MLRAFRDAWATACTDGSFSQTQCQLIDEDDTTRRCCLGVALDVGVKMGLLTKEQADERNDEDYETEMLTDKQCELLGINPDTQSKFAESNDNNVAFSGEYYPSQVLDRIRTYPVID